LKQHSFALPSRSIGPHKSTTARFGVDPIENSRQLNERHYPALKALTKPGSAKQ
jgi:bisphosphoglycerate-dependent phosphoglycerate mutase